MLLCVGIEVQDEDERHPRVARQHIEQLIEGFQSAGRGADPNHEEVIGPCLSAWPTASAPGAGLSRRHGRSLSAARVLRVRRRVGRQYHGSRPRSRGAELLFAPGQGNRRRSGSDAGPNRARIPLGPAVSLHVLPLLPPTKWAQRSAMPSPSFTERDIKLAFWRGKARKLPSPGGLVRLAQGLPPRSRVNSGAYSARTEGAYSELLRQVLTPTGFERASHGRSDHASSQGGRWPRFRCHRVLRRADPAARRRSRRDRGQRVVLPRLPDRSRHRRPARSLSRSGAGEWDVPQLRSLLNATLSGAAEVDAYEMDLKRDGRAPRRLVITAHQLDYGDAANVRLLLAVSDVTDARLAERLKDDLLREKAILFQELQHRVANSLQIIASVLMQSARRVPSAETRSHLYDAHSRVMSVAALQQQLAASKLGDVRAAPLFHRAVREHRRLDDPRPREAAR